ncbi:hypothetical protein GMRT_14043 [Giardia muris]|uniref:Uncharacterized protein n=1 Tax=Giardia muris TaxID=5742 RepID=A0A4Z1SUA9_GIAMU|nr:hypothetical protein GMRT_14043 [Giardia muris]|eukprot:TNJ27198.1 hypothetical protein GMRT_14043 [Giardia muris]
MPSYSAEAEFRSGREVVTIRCAGPRPLTRSQAIGQATGLRAYDRLMGTPDLRLVEAELMELRHERESVGSRGNSRRQGWRPSDPKTQDSPASNKGSFPCVREHSRSRISRSTAVLREYASPAPYGSQCFPGNNLFTGHDTSRRSSGASPPTLPPEFRLSGCSFGPDFDSDQSRRAESRQGPSFFETPDNLRSSSTIGGMTFFTECSLDEIDARLNTKSEAPQTTRTQPLDGAPIHVMSYVIVQAETIRDCGVDLLYTTTPRVLRNESVGTSSIETPRSRGREERSRRESILETLGGEYLTFSAVSSNDYQYQSEDVGTQTQYLCPTNSRVATRNIGVRRRSTVATSGGGEDRPSTIQNLRGIHALPTTDLVGAITVQANAELKRSSDRPRKGSRASLRTRALSNKKRLKGGNSTSERKEDLPAHIPCCEDELEIRDIVEHSEDDEPKEQGGEKSEQQEAPVDPDAPDDNVHPPNSESDTSTDGDYVDSLSSFSFLERLKAHYGIDSPHQNFREYLENLSTFVQDASSTQPLQFQLLEVRSTSSSRQEGRSQLPQESCPISQVLASNPLPQSKEEAIQQVRITTIGPAPNAVDFALPALPTSVQRPLPPVVVPEASSHESTPSVSLEPPPRQIHDDPLEEAFPIDITIEVGCKSPSQSMPPAVALDGSLHLTHLDAPNVSEVSKGSNSDHPSITHVALPILRFQRTATQMTDSTEVQPTPKSQVQIQRLPRPLTPGTQRPIARSTGWSRVGQRRDPLKVSSPVQALSLMELSPSTISLQRNVPLEEVRQKQPSQRRQRSATMGYLGRRQFLQMLIDEAEKHRGATRDHIKLKGWM